MDSESRIEVSRRGTCSLRLLVYVCVILCVTGESENYSRRSIMALNSVVYFANTSLVSAGGVYEVGLTSGRSSYTLAIWYAQLPVKTVVWVADRSMAFDNVSINGSSLKLSAQGDLQLFYHNGSRSSPNLPLWTSNTANMNVTRATIEDTGNLVLLNKANQVVWQSFDSPTDTLLPNQTFSNKRILTAWQNDGDWSQGKYSLKWNNNASTLMAYWQNPYKWYSSPNNTYWNPLSLQAISSEFSYAVLTGDGEFRAVGNISNSNSIIAKTANRVDSRRLVRLTLDVDGNVRMYSWSVESGNWTVEWTAVDECSVSGRCGPYAICQDGQCRCPQGFHLVDATDQRQGCTRTESVVCGNTDTGVADTFGPVEYVDWGFFADWGANSDLGYFSNVGVGMCRERCLNNCQCQAIVMSIAEGNSSTVTCWLKQAPLLNGTSNSYRQSFLRIAGSIQAPTQAPAQAHSMIGIPRRVFKISVYTVSVAAGILILLSCLFGSCYFSWTIQKHRQKRLHDKWVAAKGAMIRFTYREMMLMTENFSVEIGKGGFGTVFKGQIGQEKNNSHVQVAVKRLNRELSNQVEKEFLNEVNSIGLIHHVNLVSLIGYCAEADHRLLVYEYVERGSLDTALFEGGCPVLEWRPRFAIAIHTARGLAYLHEDCNQQIIHCDVKPENILLDSMLAAKVADFGISRIMKRDQTCTVTMHVRGTRGYLAPEYWASDCVSITNKVDVFSYGMVLLEIISGRRNLMMTSLDGSHDDRATDSILYFPTWAFPKIETEAFMEVVDPALAGIVNPEEVRRALQVAFWCINGKPHARPSMNEVVQMLQGQVPIDFPVPRPDYFDILEFDIDERGLDERVWSSDSLKPVLLLEQAGSANLTINSQHDVR